MIISYEKNMEENKIEKFVNFLVEQALETNVRLGYDQTGKLTGEETRPTVNAILEIWPEAGLTIEEAEEVVSKFNSIVEAAKAERDAEKAADKYAEEGVTKEEVESEGNRLESNFAEISQDRENEAQK